MGAGLKACHCCGLVQRVAEVPSGYVARCARCRSVVRHATIPKSASRVAALSIAALILYLPAMMLPILEIEQMGQTQSATIWSGVVSLLAEGEVFVGVVVLICSVVAPLAKIGAMLVLAGGDLLLHQEHRALTYRVVEWIGRWGMLDVLLVTLLVAAVKLGSWVEVHPGPGVAAFSGVVILSLLASAAFDQHAIWEPPTRGARESHKEGGRLMSTNTPPEDTIPDANIVKRPLAWSWAWVIPVVVLVMIVTITVQSYARRGPVIFISFADAQGLSAGSTLRHRGLQVGTVEEVTLGGSLTTVVAKVRLEPEAASLAVEGSSFWIVRPEISLQRVSGLDTLLGPQYIAVSPGEGERRRVFDGLARAPSIAAEEDGLLRVVVLGERRGSITAGTPVLFRDIQVGEVRGVALAGDATRVEVTLGIEDRYAPLVRDNTRFWNASGISADFGFGGLTLRADSLESVITGGVAFATPNKPGELVEDGHVFVLESEIKADWLRWDPAIELE
jgi:paraquat-inducible protein B